MIRSPTYIDLPRGIEKYANIEVVDKKGDFVVQPTLDIHPQMEFHFAENTDSSGCCCFWRSRTVRPNEYFVSKMGFIEPFKKNKNENEARIVANNRLADLVVAKFDESPVENHIAFERLRERINHDFDNGDPITEEKLMAIVNAIYEVKEEVKDVWRKKQM